MAASETCYLDRAFKVIDKIFAQYGLDIPQDYLCFDLETTGFVFSFVSDQLQPESADDVIVEVGHCDVNNGVAEDYWTTILDWTKVPEYVEADWIRAKIATVTEHMARDNKPFHVSYDRMCAEGEHPIETLDRYVNLLERALNKGKMIAGVNIMQFDQRVFFDATFEWLGEGFQIPLDRIIDLGVIEKARQLNILPRRGECLSDYFRRVAGVRKAGVRWSVDHCCEVYGLTDAYGIRDEDKHSAGFDAMLCHLLLEEMRDRAGS